MDLQRKITVSHYNSQFTESRGAQSPAD